MRARWLLAVACGALACDREASLCRERMTQAQAVVNGLDPKSTVSLTASLAAVEQAHASCEKAKLGAEREQLLKAKHEISAQLALLETRAHRKRLAAPTAEELSRLVKEGDPSCPKGQAYKPRDASPGTSAAKPREVRCTGPQLVDMSGEALKVYFGERHFKIKSQASPAEVRAELGSELYVFEFEQLSDAAPRCVTAYAAPGMSWQELTSRLTGVSPEKLKANAPVRTERGELSLKVEHPEDKPTVRLGHCAG